VDTSALNNKYSWAACDSGWFIISFVRSMTSNAFDTSDKLARLDGIWCGIPENTYPIASDCKE